MVIPNSSKNLILFLQTVLSSPSMRVMMVSPVLILEMCFSTIRFWNVWLIDRIYGKFAEMSIGREKKDGNIFEVVPFEDRR